MKSGFKSTEFWLTLLTNIASVYLMSKGQINPETAAMVLGGANAVYTGGRSHAKRKESD